MMGKARDEEDDLREARQTYKDPMQPIVKNDVGQRNICSSKICPIRHVASQLLQK